MPRRPSPPPPKPPDWAPDKTYAALQKQLAELDRFRGRNWREVEHEETGWRNLTLNILTHGFGEDSNNVHQFHTAKWAGQHSMGGMSEGQIQNNFDKRIEAITAMLKSSLAELELMGAGDAAAPSVRERVVAVKSNSRIVFLVHGRNDAVKESVARGGLASAEQLNPRARQNVILELGYFIGRLGRARVCALYMEGVEIPSDIHGVLYVPYGPNNGWRLKLAHEIRAAGISIDLNRT